MPARRSPRPKEPLVLWWMPIMALAAPIVYAAWKGAAADGDAIGEAAFALVWPGIPLYLGALAVLWAGWKIELE